MSTSTQLITSFELEPWRDLRGKVVMVTGASSGLGWEFRIDLAKAGCMRMIVAAARRTDRLNALCDQINKTDATSEGKADDGEVRAVAVELDVTSDGHTIEARVLKAWNAFGVIDVLINDAGLTDN